MAYKITCDTHGRQKSEVEGQCPLCEGTPVKEVFQTETVITKSSPVRKKNVENADDGASKTEG